MESRGASVESLNTAYNTSVAQYFFFPLTHVVKGQVDPDNFSIKSRFAAVFPTPDVEATNDSRQGQADGEPRFTELFPTPGVSPTDAL
jgi:hypothetical protein